VNPPLHHIGYVVEDLDEAVVRFTGDHGAGPFFALEHMRFDEVTFMGEPAHYDHSSAFGSWGPLIVELSVVFAAHPAGLARALAKPGGGLGHIAWLADSLEEETARLESLGFTPFHTGRTGPASAVWFHSPFGHPVEVLQTAPEILGFYDGIRAAGAGWDGARPLRAAGELF
jgi:catechol 2,3-dioxygenase-like lactoylglutathione lyase family enzyme